MPAPIGMSTASSVDAPTTMLTTILRPRRFRFIAPRSTHRLRIERWKTVIFLLVILAYLLDHKASSPPVGARAADAGWGGPLWSPASCSSGSHLAGTIPSLPSPSVGTMGGCEDRWGPCACPPSS